MRIRLLFLLFFFSSICISFISCTDDDKQPKITYPEDEKITRWIYSHMDKNYFWYDEMPEESKLDFSAKPENFFTSLLSSKDGKVRNDRNHHYYSRIDNLGSSSTRGIYQTEYSYGFEYAIANFTNSNTLAALILYVVPNSPAADANLKRGDWITHINGKVLTTSNYSALYGGSDCIFSLANCRISNGYAEFTFSHDVEIESAREVEENPIQDYRVLNHNGKNVGYLLYTHFTDGKTDGDNSYDQKLRDISNEFAGNGVNEFVLDLRYNGGGYLSCAQILCSILAPASSLGKSFGYMEFNDKTSPRKQQINVTQSHLGSTGKNLDLDRVFVLVSSSSASASEFVINALRPYMDVIIIGDKTEGKNVGAVSQKSDDGEWEISPIVCQIYNSEGFSDYSNGFLPDIAASETSNLNNFQPLGNENETLLSIALDYIDGNYTRSSGISTSDNNMEIIYSSIERRATNGVLISPENNRD